MTLPRDQQIPADGITRLIAHVQTRTGLDIPPARLATSRTAVQRAMMQSEISDVDRYRATLDEDDRAFDALVEALTVGETYFFRDPRQLAFIRTEAIAEILRRRGEGHTISVWSAGCATGEEAYTLAILLHELGLDQRRRILGTDLSRRRLVAARRGLYGKWSLRGVAAQVVDRYFHRVGAQFELIPAIRTAVRFKYFNLVDKNSSAGHTGAFDLIVCRNVLIYFDAPAIALAARRFVDQLAEGGWLILGPSDPPLPDSLGCEVVVTDAGIAYHRSTRARPAPAAWTPSPVTEAAPVSIATVSGPARDVPPPEPRQIVPGRVASADAGATRGPEALLAAARAFYLARQYDLAVVEAQECLRRGGDVEGWIVLVRALADAGRVSEAALACAAALEAHPTSAELSVLQSLLHGELGQHERAAVAARQALYLDRELVVAHLASGSAMLRSGDERGARRAFRNALRLLEPIAPDTIVPASGGEPAARLTMLARSQLQHLGGGRK